MTTPHPAQDTGIRLHAASGNVNVQAQSAALNITAKQAVDMQSTQASVHLSAPQRIVLNGAGSYLLIDGGNIELGTSGAARFRASAKSWRAEAAGAGRPAPAHAFAAALQGHRPSHGIWRSLEPHRLAR